MSESSRLDFLGTPQQDLQTLIMGEEHDPGLQYALDRSCTPHCVEAAAEMLGVRIPSLERLQEYVAFLRANGANIETGTSNETLYGVDDGWYNIAIADLLRTNGFTVVLQNMSYDAQGSDMNKALEVGRVRSEVEQVALGHLTNYGGADRTTWLGAVNETLRAGKAMASIVIPSSTTENTFGRHSVLIVAADEEFVQYFDPDKFNVDRYGDDAAGQEIERNDPGNLIYRQPTAKFLARMSGEVMHIFPPSQATSATQ